MSIHGHPLEITVVGCSKLKDTEWISRQDPYVCLEYASTKYRTKTCTDGGKNPKFQEKFVFPLIEGLRELNVIVWNSNTITVDDFIGSGKVQLTKVLQTGYDDTEWPLWGKTGSPAGKIQVIMHYANARQQSCGYLPGMAMPAGLPPPATVPPAYSYNPQSSLYSMPPSGAYPPNPYGAPSPYPSHQPSAYPPQTSIYPPPSTASVYPPPTSVSVYPQQTYPPASVTYPPPPAGYSHNPPPGYPPAQYGSHYPPSAYPSSYPPKY